MSEEANVEERTSAPPTPPTYQGWAASKKHRAEKTMPDHVSQILKVEGPNACERMRAYFTDFDQTDSPTKRREQWRAFDFGKITEP